MSTARILIINVSKMCTLIVISSVAGCATRDCTYLSSCMSVHKPNRYPQGTYIDCGWKEVYIPAGRQVPERVCDRRYR